MSLDGASGGINLGTAYGKIVFSSNANQAISEAQTQLQNGFQRIGGGVQQFGGQLTTLGTQMTLLTAPMTLFGRSGLNAARDFDAAMTEISARTGLVGEDLKRIEDAAIQMGAETKFSAQQAAEGFLELLSSGQTAEEALITLPQVLTAAAAGSLDLGMAADTVTDIMAAFQLSANESGTVVDALARAASSSSADIASLAQGFANVGPVANTFGISVGETAAILATFSENGIKGSEAGTQLRSMLNNMTRDTEEVTGMWNALGISMFTATGEARPLQDVIMDLNAALDGASDETRNNVIRTLAGSYGQMGLTALLASEGLAPMQEKMSEASDAASVAATMMETFDGAVESLGGSIETLQISAIRPWMNETLKPLVLRAIEVVNAITAWTTQNPELTKQIVTLAAVISALAPTLVVVGIAISTIGTAIVGLGSLVALALSPIGLLIGAVVALGVAWSQNWLGIRDMTQPVVDMLVNTFGAVYRTIDFFIADLRNFGLREAILGIFGLGSTGEGQQSTLEGALVMMGFSRETAIRIVDSIVNTFTRIRDVLGPLFNEIATLVSNLFGRIDLSKLAEIGMTLWSLTTPIGQVMTALKLLGVDIFAVFEDIIRGVTRFLAAINQGGDVFAGLRASFGQSKIIDFIQNTFKKLSDTVTKVVIPALKALGEWFVEKGLPAAIDFVEDTVIPAIGDFFDLIADSWARVQPVLFMLADWFINTGLPAVVRVVQDMVIPAVGDFIQLLADMWVTVQTSLVQFANWFIQDGLPAIANFIQTTAIPAVNDFINLIAGIWALVEPVLAVFANWFIQDALPSVIAIIRDSFLPLVGDVIGTLQAIWARIAPGLQRLHQWFVTEGLPAVLSFISDTALPAIGVLIDILRTIWEVVSPPLTSLLGWFVDLGLPLILNFITDVALPVVDFLINALMDIWRLVEPVLNLLVLWWTEISWPLIELAINGGILVIQALIGIFSTIWDVVSVPLGLFKDGVEAIFSFIVENVMQPVLTIIEDIILKIGEAVQFAQELPEAVDEFFSTKDGNGGLFGSGIGPDVDPFGFIRSFDTGGSISAGQMALIGQGAQPELFVPNTGGTMIPNFDKVLASMGGGGGIQIGSVTVNANTYEGGQAAARGFAEELELRMRERDAL